MFFCCVPEADEPDSYDTEPRFSILAHPCWTNPDCATPKTRAPPRHACSGPVLSPPACVRADGVRSTRRHHEPVRTGAATADGPREPGASPTPPATPPEPTTPKPSSTASAATPVAEVPADSSPGPTHIRSVSPRPRECVGADPALLPASADLTGTEDAAAAAKNPGGTRPLPLSDSEACGPGDTRPLSPAADLSDSVDSAADEGHTNTPQDSPSSGALANSEDWELLLG